MANHHGTVKKLPYCSSSSSSSIGWEELDDDVDIQTGKNLIDDVVVVVVSLKE